MLCASAYCDTDLVRVTDDPDVDAAYIYLTEAALMPCRDTIPCEAHAGTDVWRSLLGRTTRAMTTVRARRDMDEVAGFDRFEAMPDTAWHDVRVAGAQQDPRLDADRLLVTIVKDQFHRSAHDVQELVAVGVDLAAVRSGSIDVEDSSDRVPVDSPWRSRRGRCDGHRPVASDVRNAPFEADRRRVRDCGHAPRLPALEQRVDRDEARQSRQSRPHQERSRTRAPGAPGTA